MAVTGFVMNWVSNPIRITEIVHNGGDDKTMEKLGLDVVPLALSGQPSRKLYGPLGFGTQNN